MDLFQVRSVGPLACVGGRRAEDIRRTGTKAARFDHKSSPPVTTVPLHLSLRQDTGLPWPQARRVCGRTKGLAGVLLRTRPEGCRAH